MCDNSASSQDNQGQCKFLAYMFYQSIRDHKPVWMLEEMRTMEAFYWEENAKLRTYTPSEALLYAVVHNHLPYAQYLLSRYADEALEMPGGRFCSCPSSAPHLGMAVRYDRSDMLGLILKFTSQLPGFESYVNRQGCFHLDDGITPLHSACELLRAESALILLGSGASPNIVDSKGLTPLDVILEQLQVSEINVEASKLCIDHLLYFTSNLQFKMKRDLKDNPAKWSRLLGEERYNCLSGKTPATLFLISMQGVLRCLPPSDFPASVKELPIPQSLKPLPSRRLTVHSVDVPWL